MKKLVGKESDFIRADEIDRARHLVAYKCRNSNKFCYLAKLVSDGVRHNAVFGFVPLSCVGYPRYTSSSFEESIDLVSEAGRDVYVFDNMNDMLENLLKISN